MKIKDQKGLKLLGFVKDTQI